MEGRTEKQEFAQRTSRLVSMLTNLRRDVLVEMEGAPAEPAVELLGRESAFRVVNLLQEETVAAETRGVKVKPYEITTVRLPAQ